MAGICCDVSLTASDCKGKFKVARYRTRNRTRKASPFSGDVL
jgi:hypothetical protein